MSFVAEKYRFLSNNSENISRMLNMNEEKHFLELYLTEKQINKLIKGRDTNSDCVLALIGFIQYRNHEQLYDALRERLLEIHQFNKIFLNDWENIDGIQTKESKEADYIGEKVKMSINIEQNNPANYSVDASEQMVFMKNYLSFTKETISDLQLLCEETENFFNSYDMQITSKILQEELFEAEKIILSLQNQLKEIKQNCEEKCAEKDKIICIANEEIANLRAEIERTTANLNAVVARNVELEKRPEAHDDAKTVVRITNNDIDRAKSELEKFAKRFRF